MSTRTWIIGIGLSILLLIAAGGGYFYTVYWQPHRLLYHDEAWLESASEEEIRLVCHRIISLRMGSPHDAFLYLQQVGNKESVPPLIRALKWQDPNDTYIVCTTGHCIDALRSLTGEDYKRDYRQWEDWWTGTGRFLPSDHFHARESGTGSEAASESAPEATLDVPET